jgi:hypothetical protein
VLPVIRLQDLTVSHRIKYLIRTGEDPDDLTWYCYPNGSPDRSRALFAVIQALLGTGHDDATIASVVMDKQYGISEKVLSQKNARNPRYWEQTKYWVAKEIARAKAKQPPTLAVSGQATPPAASSQGGSVPSTVWGHAITAQEFLQQVDADLPADVKDLVVPGCITAVSAPRASGKTIVALYLGVALATGGVFRGEQLAPKRVLLVDRDNPPALIRKRLRWLGAQTVTALKVLLRDKAPPLTDKAAWSTFPVQDYDVVIVDSLGASTEGISEKEGRQTQEFLATLKDLARRGPALLCLDNTTKAAQIIAAVGKRRTPSTSCMSAAISPAGRPLRPETGGKTFPILGSTPGSNAPVGAKAKRYCVLRLSPANSALGLSPSRLY